MSLKYHVKHSDGTYRIVEKQFANLKELTDWIRGYRIVRSGNIYSLVPFATQEAQ